MFNCRRPIILSADSLFLSRQSKQYLSRTNEQPAIVFYRCNIQWLATYATGWLISCAIRLRHPEIKTEFKSVWSARQCLDRQPCHRVLSASRTPNSNRLDL